MAADWLKWLGAFLGWEKDPLKWEFSDDAVTTVQYLNRLERLRTPNPLEGEAAEARSCFLLRYYSGKREIFWANTETQELIPLSFFASYKGQKEYHPDVEIGTPKG